MTTRPMTDAKHTAEPTYHGNHFGYCTVPAAAVARWKRIEEAAREFRDAGEACRLNTDTLSRLIMAGHKLDAALSGAKP